MWRRLALVKPQNRSRGHLLNVWSGCDALIGQQMLTGQLFYALHRDEIVGLAKLVLFEPNHELIAVVERLLGGYDSDRVRPTFAVRWVIAILEKKQFN